MRVLQVNVTCNKGSTGKIAYDLWSELRKHGHEAAICYGRGADFSEPTLYRISSDLEVKLHGLQTRLTGYVGFGNTQSAHRLFDFIEDFRPDIVHLHNIHGYYINTYSLIGYLKKNKIPTIITMHDEWLFTGKCGYSYDCQRYLSGCGKCPQIREYPASWFFDRSKQEYTEKLALFYGWKPLLFAPVASWLGEKAANSTILNGKTFRTVHNGIDTDIFYPVQDVSHLRTRHSLEGKKIVLHVTPNFQDPRKGGKHVLELARRIKDDNVSIIIVGYSGKSSDLPENIIPIGRTENQAELAAYYSMADLFLITSEMECLPTVCLESLCCGTPVVGFDRGGAAESAPEGYGFFVPFGDMNALIEAVSLALTKTLDLHNPIQCAAFGAKQYSKLAMYNRYIDAYNTLLNLEGAVANLEN